MKRVSLVCIILWVTFAQGCTYMDARSSHVLEKVDLLVEEERYARAQMVLSHVPESHADYSKVEALIAGIDKQAFVYEQQVLEEGGALEKAGEWYRAKQYYQTALNNIPDSEKINSAFQALHFKQGARVAELELDLLLLQAEWLKNTVRMQDELALITPGSWLKESRWKRDKERSKKVAESLAEQGEIALEQGDLSHAETLLNLAWQLNPAPMIGKIKQAVEESLQLLMQLQAENKRRQQQIVIESRARMRAILNASLLKAIDNLKLINALDYVAKLKLLGDLNEREIALVQRLALLLDRQVKESIAQGVEHYGLGQYIEAINAWKKTLVLEPDNEQAIEHIGRAERILEKLQLLRDSKKESSKL
ncbi:hypothetical protein MNBD_GAMMA17-204 [hydrothermal vent metagenome]|uniref:Tetratricopeptide repeat protein n=1 Tax=hydrothermal vent metagenome TaxID=652676 RepID=A0A3B1AAK9_9ZZZZ